MKVDNTTSQFKPHSNDLLWLGHHASYLDTILLQAVDGPWKQWNDLSVDLLARSFLELVVRASPTRKYPDLIDEKVRKWMKRKKIGLSSQYGANPGYLAEAKITEDGIQPKNGWTTWPKRENKTTPFPAQSFRSKAVAGPVVEKKPPI